MHHQGSNKNSARSRPRGAIRNISVRKASEKHLAYSHNEARLRTVVDTAVDGVILIDANGSVLMFNRACERLFGYRTEEMLGKNVKCLMPAPYSEEHDHHLDNYHRTGKRKIIGTGREVVGLRKDGMTFPMRLSVGEAVEEGKSVFVGIIHDLTESEESEAKYRGLLEAAPDAMVVVNQAGDIVLLNLQAEKQFGYRRDELLGQQVTNIIPVGFAERLIADDLRSAEEALAQQIGTGIELIARRKDGSEFPIELMLSPLASAEGTLVTAAIRNISVRKRLERLKDEFVATVSHELRTPLTSISGSLGLLTGTMAGNLPDATRRLLAIAHENSQRLVRLVNNILDINKLESGLVAFKFGRVEVRSLVERAIEANRGFAEHYGVRIRLDDAASFGDVRADPDRLTQVVTNLLSNSIKFSPADTQVLVKIEKRPGVIRLSVRDHGAGIPADFKPSVFEKFAQADTTNVRETGGTGLGLSIVKQIVDRLGGETGFTDAPGGGTVFHVELPCLGQFDVAKMLDPIIGPSPL